MASLKGPAQKGPDDDKVSPSQDHTDRFANDILLRKYGFQIAGRPKKGQPVWQRNGHNYYQSDALKEVATQYAPEGKKRGVA